MISVLLRYQELALEGRNRPWFQRHLIGHLHRALAGLSVQQIRVPMGRIEVVLGRESTTAEVRCATCRRRTPAAFACASAARTSSFP